MKNQKKLNYWDIPVTRSLLEKPESELSDLENEAVKYHRLGIENKEREFRAANEELRANCGILCSGYAHNLIPSPGWIEPVKIMAYRLEKLNYFYAKYGMRVVFDQVKEKFGYFTGYWSIHRRPRGFLGFTASLLEDVCDFIGKHVKFRNTRVEDAPGFVQLQWEECDEEEYTEKLDRCGRKLEDSDIWKAEELMNDTPVYAEGVEYLMSKTYFKAEDGKYYRSYWLHHSPKYHYEQLNHKWLFKFRLSLIRAVSWLSCFHTDTPEETVMYNAFFDECSEIVSECETACAARCEDCGERIDNDSRCETHGWISFICRRCAEASGRIFYDNGDGKWHVEDRITENPYQSAGKKQS